MKRHLLLVLLFTLAVALTAGCTVSSPSPVPLPPSSSPASPGPTGNPAGFTQMLGPPVPAMPMLELPAEAAGRITEKKIDESVPDSVRYTLSIRLDTGMELVAVINRTEYDQVRIGQQVVIRQVGSGDPPTYGLFI